MDKNIKAEDAAHDILDYVKCIATIFDLCDGRTENAMVCISISDGFIFISAANHDENNRDMEWIFRLQYDRDNAEIISLKVE